MILVGIIPFVILLAVVFRLVAGQMDSERVEQYVREQGWTLLDRSWDPFGPGWFGEKNARIYEIVYRDRQGNVHRAHVKTSLFSGVYLTHDQIVEHSSQQQDLESENARLRRRIAELERHG